VSTEAHSFITIPLKTQLEPQVSSSQCLKELSYVEIFKDLRTQDHKFKNRVPKRIFRSKILGYIRWRNILLEEYQVLMKNDGSDWLDTHGIREGAAFFCFYFLHFIFESFYFLSFYFYFILFLTTINLLIFVLVRKDCC
jgi:hypothetical protein